MEVQQLYSGRVEELLKAHPNWLPTQGLELGQVGLFPDLTLQIDGV